MPHFEKLDQVFILAWRCRTLAKFDDRSLSAADRSDSLNDMLKRKRITAWKD